MEREREREREMVLGVVVRAELGREGGVEVERKGREALGLFWILKRGDVRICGRFVQVFEVSTPGYMDN